MNKLTKKIVSLATMAAFMVTVPVSAFAAAPGTVPVPAEKVAVATDSTIGFTGGDKPGAKVDQAMDVTVSFKNGAEAIAKQADGVNLHVWAEKDGKVADHEAFVAVADPALGVEGGKDVVYVKNDKLGKAAQISFKVKFQKEGTYKLHAALTSKFETPDKVKVEEKLKEENNTAVVTAAAVPPAPAPGPGQPAASVKGTAVADASVIDFEGGNQEAKAGEHLTARIHLIDKDGNAATAVENQIALYIWAEPAYNVNQTTTALAVAADKNELGLKKDQALDSNMIVIKYDQLKGAVKKGAITVPVKFVRSGKYVIKAALAEHLETPQAYKNAGAQLNTNSGKGNQATISASSQKAAQVIAKYDGESYNLTKDKAKALKVKANGVTPSEVKLEVKTKDGKSIGSGKEVKFETNSANIEVNKKSEKTDYAGKVSFKVTGQIKGEYKVYITVDGEDYILPVAVDTLDASNIRLVKEEKAPVSKDEDFASEKALKDFIRFELTDINGNVKVGDGEKVMSSKAGDRENYVKLLDAPGAFRGKARDFRLVRVSDKDYYTLVYTGSAGMVEGKYTVRVHLDNGRSAQATFEVKKFDTPVSLHVEYATNAVELGAQVKAPTFYFLDKNGVKKSADKYITVGYNGYAVEPGSFSKDGNNIGAFKVKHNESYLGAKITVLAVSERYNLTGKAELTVAKDGRTLKFLSNRGVINANNKVQFQIVDADGKAIKPWSGMTSVVATIISKSNADARISATTKVDNDLNDRGLGTLTLTSDKAGTAEIQVVATDKNSRFYVGTLKYTFGTSAGYAGRTVVMTIGAKQVIVDNNVVNIDTAAIIKNNRTFVPYRALLESFGAKVDYKDNIVTAELNGTKVEMKIGEKTYKVSGKEKTMDVAPFIQNDRTMIPVRFVAEAFGFKVMPTYNANGTTASVGFTM